MSVASPRKADVARTINESSELEWKIYFSFYSGLSTRKDENKHILVLPIQYLS